MNERNKMDIVPSQPPPPPIVKSSLIEAAQQPTTLRARRARRQVAGQAVARVQVAAAQVAVTEARADLKLGALDRVVDRAEMMAVNAAQRARKLVELAPEATHEIGDLEQIRQLATRQLISQTVDELGR